MTAPATYSHTQRGRLHVVLLAAAGGLALAAACSHASLPLTTVLLVMAVVLAAVSLCISTLTVRDENDGLLIRFGPLPLSTAHIPYRQITEVERDRTRFIDGWGIHFIPWRGWTYNIWGFDCVKIRRGKRIIRVGTDDADNLLAFLESKLEQL